MASELEAESLENKDLNQLLTHEDYLNNSLEL